MMVGPGRLVDGGRRSVGCRGLSGCGRRVRSGGRRCRGAARRRETMCRGRLSRRCAARRDRGAAVLRRRAGRDRTGRGRGTRSRRRSRCGASGGPQQVCQARERGRRPWCRPPCDGRTRRSPAARPPPACPLRPSILMAKAEPAGRPTVRVSPSSRTARELCSRAPREGCAAVTWRTTSTLR